MSPAWCSLLSIDAPRHGSTTVLDTDARNAANAHGRTGAPVPHDDGGTEASPTVCATVSVRAFEKYVFSSGPTHSKWTVRKDSNMAQIWGIFTSPRTLRGHDDRPLAYPTDPLGNDPVMSRRKFKHKNYREGQPLECQLC
jgi:hypothetical protein